MTRLLDGLLNSHDDLLLLSLAIRDAATHALFLQTALLRPSTPSTTPSAAAAAHPSIPTRRAIADISASKPHLFVPHLRLPWASTLADLILRHFNVTLVPSADHLSPNPHLYDQFLDLLNTADTSSKHWNNAVRHFYAPLSLPHTQYNAVVLAHIRNTYGPLAVEKITGCVRLAFVNTLLLSLRRSAATSESHAADIHTRRSERLANPPIKHFTITPRTRSYPPVIPARHPDTRPKPSRTTHLPNRTLSNHRSRPSSANSSIVLRGYPIPDLSSNVNKSPSFLIHGVVISGRLLSTITKILAERYGVYIYIEDQVPRTPHPAGSLASLSNFGTALLRRPHVPPMSVDWYSPPQHYWHPSGSPLRPGRGPSAVNESVDKYLMDTFGVRWSNVCATVVEEATEIVETKSLLELAEQKQYLDEAIRLAESIRTSLIRRAIDYEVAGTPLSRMCAFTIARYMPCAEVERELECFSPEYTQLLQEAKCRIQQLEASDSISARDLVPPLHVERF